MSADQSEAWARAAALVRPTTMTPAAVARAGRPDNARAWCPASLLPLHGTAEWNALSSTHRRTYGQVYAGQLLAEFIWIERNLILSPLVRLVEGGKIRDPGADEALRSFIVDEEHHIAGFRAALAAAQNANAAVIEAADGFSPPFIVRAGAALARFAPVECFFWTRVVEAFEAYAVDIGRHYNADKDVDPLLREVFVAHARDEARHCRFDDLLANSLRDAVSNAWRPINRALASGFRSSYLDVEWGLDTPIDVTLKQHPELHSRRAALVEAARVQRRTNAAAALRINSGE